MANRAIFLCHTYPTLLARTWQAVGFGVVGTVPGAFRRPSGEYVGLHVMYLDLT